MRGIENTRKMHDVVLVYLKRVRYVRSRGVVQFGCILGRMYNNRTYQVPPTNNDPARDSFQELRESLSSEDLFSLNHLSTFNLTLTSQYVRSSLQPAMLELNTSKAVYVE